MPGLQGRLCTFYASGYYQVCQRHPEVPRLTAQQHAAFAEFERLAGSPELFMQYELQPGDIQVAPLLCAALVLKCATLSPMLFKV